LSDRTHQPISTEEYWEARAHSAEEGLAVARVDELKRTRIFLESLARVVATTDGLIEISRQTSELSARALRMESNTMVDRLVKSYSLEGPPGSYELDLSGGPGGSVLRQKETASE